MIINGQSSDEIKLHVFSNSFSRDAAVERKVYLIQFCAFKQVSGKFEKLAMTTTTDMHH